MVRTCVVFTMVLLAPFVSAWSQATSQTSEQLTRFVKMKIVPTFIYASTTRAQV
jgi:hypothetical protein